MPFPIFANKIIEANVTGKFYKSKPGRSFKRIGEKNFSKISLVDRIISLDDERKKLQFELDETQSKINAFSKEIGH